jgi:hypothetical protein
MVRAARPIAGALLLATACEGASDAAPPVPATDWVRQIGNSGDERAAGLAIDSLGHLVALADATTTEGPLTDLTLTKIDGSGRMLWTTSLGGPQMDTAGGVAVDSHDRIVVTGYTSGTLTRAPSAGSNDVVIARFAPDGAREWTRQIGSTFNDYGLRVAIGPDDSITVVGYTEGAFAESSPSGGWDAFAARFDANGVMLWVTQLGTVGADLGRDVVVDGEGRSRIVGTTNGDFDQPGVIGSWDVFVAELDPDGTWSRTTQLRTPDDERVYAMDGGPDGLYLVGDVDRWGVRERVFGAHKDAFITKFTIEGAVEWTEEFATQTLDQFTDVVVTRDGDVWASGVSAGALGEANMGNWDAVVSGIGPGGERLGTVQFGTVEADAAARVAADSAGDLYVAGTTRGDLDVGSGGDDLFVASLRLPATGASPNQRHPENDEADDDHNPRDPMARLPVRVHAAASERTDAELATIFAEVNRIWSSEADVCFEFEVVQHEELREDGFDVRFEPGIGPPNGRHPGDDHAIWVRDRVTMQDSDDPALDPVARTLAHELGHGLGLPHSNVGTAGPGRREYVMRQYSSGWRIASDAGALEKARDRAEEKTPYALGETCGAPVFPP